MTTPGAGKLNLETLIECYKGKGPNPIIETRNERPKLPTDRGRILPPSFSLLVGYASLTCGLPDMVIKSRKREVISTAILPWFRPVVSSSLKKKINSGAPGWLSRLSVQL